MFKDSWHGNSSWIKNKSTGNEKWNRERTIHKQLSSIIGSDGIVKYRGEATEDEIKELQRLYTEYCPHGDLSKLLRKHAVTYFSILIRALWSLFHG
jgi:hypothetical protein